MFGDEAFRTRVGLSAVNSINWARVMAQVVYYVWASSRLGRRDVPTTFCVPTGNFGNVFAGHVAHRMGLPVERFVVASNTNDILTRADRDRGGDRRGGRAHPLAEHGHPDLPEPRTAAARVARRQRRGETAGDLLASFRSTWIERELTPDVQHAPARRRSSAGDSPRATTETLAIIADVHARTGLLDRAAHGRSVSAPPVGCGVPTSRSSRSTTAHPAKFPDAVEQATRCSVPVCPPHLARSVRAALSGRRSPPHDLGSRRRFRGRRASGAERRQPRYVRAAIRGLRRVVAEPGPVCWARRRPLTGAAAGFRGQDASPRRPPSEATGDASIDAAAQGPRRTDRRSRRRSGRSRPRGARKGEIIDLVLDLAAGGDGVRHAGDRRDLPADDAAADATRGRAVCPATAAAPDGRRGAPADAAAADGQ